MEIGGKVTGVDGCTAHDVYGYWVYLGREVIFIGMAVVANGVLRGFYGWIGRIYDVYVTLTCLGFEEEIYETIAKEVWDVCLAFIFTIKNRPCVRQATHCSLSAKGTFGVGGLTLYGAVKHIFVVLGCKSFCYARLTISSPLEGVFNFNFANRWATISSY